MVDEYQREWAKHIRFSLGAPFTHVHVKHLRVKGCLKTPTYIENATFYQFSLKLQLHESFL